MAWSNDFVLRFLALHIDLLSHGVDSMNFFPKMCMQFLFFSLIIDVISHHVSFQMLAEII